MSEFGPKHERMSRRDRERVLGIQSVIGGFTNEKPLPEVPDTSIPGVIGNVVYGFTSHGEYDWQVIDAE